MSGRYGADRNVAVDEQTPLPFERANAIRDGLVGGGVGRTSQAAEMGRQGSRGKARPL